MKCANNIEWLFSGAGLFLIGLIIGNFKIIVHFFKFNLKQGFYMPSTFSYFRYEAAGKLDDENYKIESRRIMSVTTFRKKEVIIDLPIYSTGKIESSYSVSDPLKMKIFNTSDSSGHYKLKVNGKRLKTFLVVSETKRAMNYQIQNRPPKEDKVLFTLFEERVIDKDYDFCGTKIIGYTSFVKIIVEFKKTKLPQAFNAIQIDKDGKIINDENSKKFNIVTKGDNKLAILELKNPEKGSGVYLWWEWQ